MDWYKFCPWQSGVRTVAAHPQSAQFTPSGWTQSPDTISLVLNEYAKIVLESRIDLMQHDNELLTLNQPTIHERIMPWVDPHKTITPTAIVLHWWEEPIEKGNIELLETLWEERGLASQFAVLADGSIYRLTPQENSFSHHAKCANHSALGIEIQGRGAEDLDANNIQFQAVVLLTCYLKEKYKIETHFRVEHENDDLRFHGVTSHKNVDIYCSDANGKSDVHDEYLERVVRAVQSY